MSQFERRTLPNKLTVTDIHQQMKQKIMNRIEVYNVLLNRCYKKIQDATKKNNTFCFFQIPTFIMGRPLYDLNSCVQYIHKKLLEGSYNISFLDAQTMCIQWTVPKFNWEELEPTYLALPAPPIESRISYGIESRISYGSEPRISYGSESRISYGSEPRVSYERSSSPLSSPLLLESGRNDYMMNNRHVHDIHIDDRNRDERDRRDEREDKEDTFSSFELELISNDGKKVSNNQNQFENSFRGRGGGGTNMNRGLPSNRGMKNKGMNKNFIDFY
jgi:hypothetical protein